MVVVEKWDRMMRNSRETWITLKNYHYLKTVLLHALWWWSFVVGDGQPKIIRFFSLLLIMLQTLIPSPSNISLSVYKCVRDGITVVEQISRPKINNYWNYPTNTFLNSTTVRFRNGKILNRLPTPDLTAFCSPSPNSFSFMLISMHNKSSTKIISQQKH